MCANLYTIERSTITGAQGVLSGGGTVYLSVFEHCLDVFRTNSTVKIDDCRFDYCMSIARDIHSNGQILNSQFNNCLGDLISTEYEILTGHNGWIEIRYYEFNNWEAFNGEDGIWTSAMLYFGRSRKNGQMSIVKNCVFNGIKAHQSFLIEGNITEKIDGLVVTVEDCEFKNCTAERENGKIIREYCEY